MLIYVFENSNNNRCGNSKDILLKIRPELLNGVMLPVNAKFTRVILKK